MKPVFIRFHEEEMVSGTYPFSEINKKNVSFRNIDENQEKMKKTLTAIKKWKNEELWFNGNKDPAILKYLTEIYFPQLTLIGLHDCKIEFQQGKDAQSEIFRDKQTGFQKGCNLIFNIEDFKKSDWKNLDYIYSYGNKIQDFKPLWHIVALKNCSVEWRSQDSQQCSDSRWFFKMKYSIVGIWLKSEGRIRQSEAQKAIKKRFPQISISNI